MYGKCVIKNCKQEEATTFHRIPKNSEQRAIWLDLLDLPPTVNGRVCSKHFEPTDLETKRDGTVWLKRFACPMQSTEPIAFSHEVEVGSSIMYNASNNVRLDVNKIYDDHNYIKRAKPISFNRASLAYNNRLLVMSLRRSLKRARNQMKEMTKEHKQEMKKFEDFTKLSNFLQEFVLLLMKKHHKASSSPKNYSPEVRKFALSLHYYSPAGYRFVRDSFNMCLPHPKTIASWYKVVDGSPGFTTESLDALADLQKRTSFQIVVSLVLDGMAIRKHLQRLGNRTIGYTDSGGVLPEVDEIHQLAKEALIYLVVGVNVPFKLQVGYFMINSLTGKQLAYLTETGVTLVQNCNLVVGSITHDGLKSQFLMDKLDCDFSDVQHLVTHFIVDEHIIFVFPDTCHMLKLARNFLCDEFEFLDGKERIASWKYFINLHKLQTSLGLHFANKVRQLHVNYRNQIMKVYLATQLFSSSVADAIEFLDGKLHLPDFKYSQGTVEFVRVMNDIFDIFNSRQMSDSFYKQPLHKENYKFIMQRLDYAKTYLTSVKHLDKKPLYAGPRYTFVVGMLVLIESLKGYYNEFVEKQKLLTFIPTYKQSQDSVEIFNGCMRSFGGYNSNPSGVVFQNAYKKSLLHVQFQEKFSGNCIPLENIPILHCPTTKATVQSNTYISDEDFENSIENALVFRSLRSNFNAYYNIIAHISGYIGRRLYSMLKCEACSQSVIYALTEEELSNGGDDEDHGYDDVIDGEDMDMESSYDLGSSAHLNTSSFKNDEYEHIDMSAEFNLNLTMEGVVYTDDNESDYDCEHWELDSLIDEDNIHSPIDDYDSEFTRSVNGEDEAMHEDIDLSGADEIATKYFGLIKNKDKGGLVYPSDSVYRIAILADIVFTTALKRSGGKMLKKQFTLNRLIGLTHSLCEDYSHILFSELKLHFELEDGHESMLITNIAKFYLKIRIDYLNKTVSANSGKRQKVLHSLHFQGM